jgi:hypothetical protein
LGYCPLAILTERVLESFDQRLCYKETDMTRNDLVWSSMTDAAQVLPPVLLWRLLLARASELARVGEYDEAQSLLCELPDRKESKSEILDLQARIHAQRGCLFEARQLWNELLADHPEHDAARAGLRRLDQIAGSATRGTHRAQRIYQAERIFTPGFVLNGDAKEAMILFERDPFSEGGHDLTESARKLLTGLGRRLEALVGQISIEVNCWADLLSVDSIPEFPEPGGLAMARSYVVLQHMLRTTKLQEWMFVLRAASDAAPPHKATPTASRSVSLRVRPC